MRHSLTPTFPRLKRALLVVVAVATLGCDASGLLGWKPGPLANLYVGGDNGRRVVLVGGTLQLGVEGRDADGRWVELGALHWRSLDTTLATVGANGTVRGKAVGDARIEVRDGAISSLFVAQIRARFCSPSAVEGPIATGETVAGRLDMHDCALPEGGTAVGTILRVTDAGLVRAALSDTSTAERVWITTATGDTVPPTGLLPVGLPFGTPRSKLVAVTPGEYHLWVATVPEGGDASYSFRADRIALCAESGAGAVPLESVHDGELGWDDCVLPSAHPADRFTITVASARTIAVSLEGVGFAPDIFLPALSPTGPFIIGAFFPNGDRRTHLLRLPAGDTELQVYSGTSSPLTGAYRVALSEPPRCEDTAAGPFLTLGDTLTGSLDVADCVWMEWEYARIAEKWRVTLAAETTLRFDMFFPEAVAHSPSLRFRRPDGTSVHFESPPVGFGHRRTEVRLPAGTSEVVVVTDHSLTDYRMAVTVAP